MPRLLSFLGRIARDRRANIGVTFALMLGPILMVSGAAVDYARLEQFKTQLQATVDSAALAGAAVYTSSSQNTAATTTATNYVTVGVKQLPGHIGTITPSASASLVTSGSNPGYTVTVSATVTMATTILHMLNQTLNVSATARAVKPTTSGCILVLDPSSSQSLLVNSGVTLNAPNCEIDVASSSTSAAMINSSLTNISSMCVDGSSTLNGGVSVNNLKNGCTTATDPFAGTITAPTISTVCQYTNKTYSGSNTLSPGTYCGSINFNGGGTITFNAGNYVFYNATVNFNSTGTLSFGAGVYSLKGTSWNINTGWTATGTGVTFYYADASSYIQFNSGVKANLAAPTSGTYANVLIFEPGGLSNSSFAIDGTSTSDLLQGLVYLPSRNITFNSAANATSDGLTLVVHQLILDTITWSISPSPKGISGSSGAGNDYLTM
jgi:Flp pilus assembly protein TadG